MATDDVLERAEALLAKCNGYELPPYTDSMIVEDLAAEVRELRKDRERLDVLETIIAVRKIVGGPWEGCLPSTLRHLADAAMKGAD